MMLPRRRPVMMNVVQDDVARRSAQRFSLSDSLFVYFAVHYYHYDARNPEGHARAYYSVGTIDHKSAHLRKK